MGLPPALLPGVPQVPQAPGVRVVVESLEMIVAHKDILLRLLTRLVGSDCCCIGSWKKDDRLRRVEVGKPLGVGLRGNPFSVVVTSCFVGDIGFLDRGILQVGN